MPSRRTIVALSLVLLGILCLAYLGTRRPVTRIAFLHTPDNVHIHQVYGGHSLTQHTAFQKPSLDGIAIIIDSQSSQINPTEEIILHVFTQDSNEELRTIIRPFGDIVQAIPRKVDEVQEYSAVYFPFDVIEGIPNEPLKFTLEAPTLSKLNALRVRYQSDATTLPGGEVFEISDHKQGNLGFVLYERPFLSTLAVEWFTSDEHSYVIPSLLVILAAIVVIWKIGLPSQVVGVTVNPASAKWVGLIFVLLAAGIFYPALNMFYFHDDLALLARAKEFQEISPSRILLAHTYLEQDPYSRFNFHFWRPISAGVYSWIVLNTLYGLPSLAFLLNVVLAAATATLLYIVAIEIFSNRLLAFLSASVWLFHPSKIKTLYWWSANHDILAGLFAALSLVLFAWWRKTGRTRYLWASMFGLTLGVWSKEHIFFLPLVLASFEYFFGGKTVRSTVQAISPFLILTGILLCIRALVFSDPSVLPIDPTDKTYALEVSPHTFGVNLIGYTGTVGLQWLWPAFAPGFGSIEDHLNYILDNMTKIPKPYYPGVAIIILFGLSAGAIYLKDDKRFRKLVFATIWWLSFFGPLLFLRNDWRERWVYLPLFGAALSVTTLVEFVPVRYRSGISATLVVITLLLGYMGARDSTRTQFYRDQANYIRVASSQFDAQVAKLTEASRVFLVGVLPDQTTSLNAYLFRLKDIPSPVPIIRTDMYPNNVTTNDIIIDMTGIEAYYPGYEQ